MTETTNDTIRAQVREHYGKVAEAPAAVGCAPSCCAPSGGDASLALGYTEGDLAAVPEGANLGLGCGNPQAIASLAAGETVLDLGSGAGFDCFLAARQVGPSGRVIGVDMTPAMLTKARRNAAKIEAKNVEFRMGEIEHLPLGDGEVDVVMSNCVVNLSPDKPAVYREAFRVLKPGGRVAISDVVMLRPIPEHLKDQALALSACVAGAASVADVEAMLEDAGFTEVKVDVSERSREFIAGWLPGSRAEDYVASASIQATKPGGAPAKKAGGACCPPGCCG
jgi:SAM-dependent methyltransferase